MKTMKNILLAVLLLSPMAVLANEQVAANLQILSKSYRFFRANAGYVLQNGNLVNFGGLDMSKPYCNVTASSKRVSFNLNGTLTITSTLENSKLVYRAIFSGKSGHDSLEVSCLSNNREIWLEDVNFALGELARVSLK